ncbi:MAG: protein-L-isoaspartate O-methyltransferase, partial [Nanoarchaeota archaeon]|nr:protein-L-isoaspartate O-methyltransferase [Nanoarchaeota archaeon]
NIKKQKIKNIKIIHTDGSKGYSKEAPYDKIIATAACPYIPKPWIEQLKDNGIIVAPVGSLYGQKMIKAKKIKEKLEQEELGEFMFVPLKGKYGFP